jgi:hypothetical protein
LRFFIRGLDSKPTDNRPHPPLDPNTIGNWFP